MIQDKVDGSLSYGPRSFLNKLSTISKTACDQILQSLAKYHDEKKMTRRNSKESIKDSNTKEHESLDRSTADVDGYGILNSPAPSLSAKASIHSILHSDSPFPYSPSPIDVGNSDNKSKDRRDSKRKRRETNGQKQHNIFDVPREKLLSSLSEMRGNFNLAIEGAGINVLKSSEKRYSVPIVVMGDYSDAMRSTSAALRHYKEDEKQYNRPLFGNPYEKSSRFIVLL